MHWDVGRYERAKLIFDRDHREFHPLDELVEVAIIDDAVGLVLATRGGKLVRGRLTYAAG